MFYSTKGLIELNTICKENLVSKLFIFKSLERQSTCFDLLVEFHQFDLKYYFQNYMSFRNSIDSIFNHRKIIIEEQTLSNPILIEHISESKTLVYDSENIKYS